MSKSNKIEDSSNNMDSSKRVLQDQSEDSCRNTTRDIEENLLSMTEHASENQCLTSSRQAKVFDRFSNQSPTTSFQAPNIDQLEKTSEDLHPARELNSHNCSRNEGALVSPRQLTTFSMSILEDWDASKAKANQKDLSPFAASRNADFTSPPERGAIMGNRSLSKNLKETNTPSPEKRSVETDVELTPTKRLRKTSKSGSGKHGTETEYYRSKFDLSAVSKSFYTSKAYLQLQQRKVGIQKNKESESPNSPSTPIKRQITRNSSVESKIANDPTLSNSISPSSPANIIDKSPSYQHMQGSQVNVLNADESPIERKTSHTKDSNLAGVLQTANLQTFPTEEIKSVSNELTDSSTSNPSLREIHSTSDMSDESAMRDFTSKKADTIIHPITLTDNSFIRPNASGKQKDRLPVSNVSFDVWQPYLPVKETEPAVHPLALADETSSSNRRTASKSQNSKTERFESFVEVKKISSSVKTSVSAKKTQPASNVADSAVKVHILESLQSSPEILNPHLPFSCHLPRRSNSSGTNVPRSKLEFDTSDKIVENDQNRSDSVTRTATPNRESRSQSNELKALGHRRSQSDVTLTSRNISSIQALQDESDSFNGSHSAQIPTSRSLLDISKDVSRSTCVGQPPLQTMPPRSTSNTTSATRNPQEFSLSEDHHQLSRDVSEMLSFSHSSRSRSNPDLQMQQNRNAPLLQSRHPRFFSGDTSRSRNQPEHEQGDDTKPPHIDVVEVQASSLRCQPLVTAGSSAHDRDSASKNRPEMTSNVHPTHIDISQGQASTTRYQPTVTSGSSSYDQASASKNRPEMTSNVNPTHIDISQGQTSTSRPSSVTSTAVSSALLETLTDFLNNLDFFPFRDAGERTRPMFDVSHPDDCLAHARSLLSCVLGKMIEYNREVNLWGTPEERLLRISDPFTAAESQVVCLQLCCYLNKRTFNYLSSAALDLLMHGLTAETFIRMIYEKLIASVVGTLAFILSLPITRDFCAFISCYSNFRSLYDDFLRDNSGYNVDDIQDETSRNRVKELQTVIHYLMLQALTAMRLLLMYVGENSNDESIAIYMTRVKDEDKMYLRRNIG